MSRYSVHPMEQNFQEYDRAYKEKRNTYWQRLRRAFADYTAKNEDGNFGTTYKVVDESKHTMFLLKYGRD